jgi:hypothetical protein
LHLAVINTTLLLGDLFPTDLTASSLQDRVEDARVRFESFRDDGPDILSEAMDAFDYPVRRRGTLSRSPERHPLVDVVSAGVAVDVCLQLARQRVDPGIQSRSEGIDPLAERVAKRIDPRTKRVEPITIGIDPGSQIEEHAKHPEDRDGK